MEGRLLGGEVISDTTHLIFVDANQSSGAGVWDRDWPAIGPVAPQRVTEMGKAIVTL